MSIKTQMGEYVVGAYLRECLHCGVVDYNVRPPGGGLAGLAEFDVIGLRFEDHTAYICEVTTHLLGLNYGSYERSISRIIEKHKRQRQYARKHLRQFPKRHFQFWSPVVPQGQLTQQLGKINGLELIINLEYSKRLEELRQKARSTASDTGNPFFRGLQILEHLRHK